MDASPILLIHGGAWDMPDDAIADHERGIASALAAGYAQLEKGATAVDAVQAAVAVMEDDETFDAGRGSFLTRDGKVQLDALLMDGATLRTGGVACVERLCNPIHAARLVLDHSPHVYFVAAGAERFARRHGMALCDNMDLVIPREQQRLYAAQTAELAGESDTTFSGPLTSHDTVGRSPETPTAISPPPPVPAARSTRHRAGSATRHLSAAAATPTTSPPPSRLPAGVSPS